MAPKKTANAPTSKLTKAEKRVINQAKHRAAQKEIRRLAAALTPDAPPERTEPRKEGRPLGGSLWTEELGEVLFEKVAFGMSLEKISHLPGMPARINLLKWANDPKHPFNKIWIEAKHLLTLTLEERAIDVAEEPLMGEIVTHRQALTKDGEIVDIEETRTSDNVERSKLKLVAYQWALGHLSPKKHGKNPDQSGGKPNEQLEGLFAALKAGPVG